MGIVSHLIFPGNPVLCHSQAQGLVAVDAVTSPGVFLIKELVIPSTTQESNLDAALVPIEGPLLGASVNKGSFINLCCH